MPTAFRPLSDEDLIAPRPDLELAMVAGHLTLAEEMIAAAIDLFGIEADEIGISEDGEVFFTGRDGYLTEAEADQLFKEVRRRRGDL